MISQTDLDKIIKYYNKKIYKNYHIKSLVINNVLTKEQYTQITGEEYK